MKLDSIILTALFDFLNDIKAEFCVINNYEDLPNHIPTDVDIAIDERTFRILDSIISKISNDNNVKIVQKIWHGYNKCAYILSPLLIDERFRLQLDFFTDFSAKGYPKLIPSEDILKYRKRFKNFYIPSPEIEFLFILMRRIIKNDLKTSHIKKMSKLMYKNTEVVKQEICRIFNYDIGHSLILLVKTGDQSIFQGNLKKYQEGLKNFSKKNMTIFYRLYYAIFQIRRAFNRILYPVGFSVALLGPDGSGKSTIANLVKERVSGSFHGGEILYWRPHLLPQMGKLKFWNPAHEIKVNPQPHAHPKQIFLKSLIRFFYYLADHLIGYLVKTYWAKVKKKIIIFDRYYYDYLVDLHRYRFNIPNSLPKLFLPIIPAPDLTIYLDAEPEELIRRKQEISLSELKRQVDEFRKVLSIIPNSIKVATNRPVEEIVKEITYLILEKKVKQTEKILHKSKFL